MNRKIAGMISCLGVVSIIHSGCNEKRNTPVMEAPVAKIEKKELTIHGDTRLDNYFWLNQRENPEVISYLEAENA
ncbi:MAG: hypothetical protein MUC31_06765, partial [Bacteroidales bacterium]|nr:hypothetical protein [Bacteroidales bacterium]